MTPPRAFELFYYPHPLFAVVTFVLVMLHAEIFRFVGGAALGLWLVDVVWRSVMRPLKVPYRYLHQFSVHFSGGEFATIYHSPFRF